LAAHFIDTGTHVGTFRDVPPTGRRVQTKEFALYRIADSKIAEFWGTAEKAPLTADDP
jgi:predicted ester cyclase